MQDCWKRNILLKPVTGGELRLANARYIPDLKKNLISTSQLDDEGYISIFGNS